MRHPAGVLDERLDTTERLTECPDLRLTSHLDRHVLPAAHPEGHHAAEAPHLTRSDVVARVVLQSGIEDLSHPVMALEEVDDGLGVVTVALHPDGEGLESAQHQPRIERPRDSAHRVLVKGNSLRHVLTRGGLGSRPRHQRSPDDIGVTAAVFRRRVHDDVGAQREGILQIGGGEGVVDGQQRSCLVGDLGDSGDVRNAEQGVGRRLDPDQLGLGPDDRAHRVEIGDLGDRVLDPQPLTTLLNSR